MNKWLKHLNLGVPLGIIFIAIILFCSYNAVATLNLFNLAIGAIALYVYIHMFADSISRWLKDVKHDAD